MTFNHDHVLNLEHPLFPPESDAREALVTPEIVSPRAQEEMARAMEAKEWRTVETIGWLVIAGWYSRE